MTSALNVITMIESFLTTHLIAITFAAINDCLASRYGVFFQAIKDTVANDIAIMIYLGMMASKSQRN